MLNKYMAAIYVEDIQLGGLTKIRNAAAVPLGGRYRVIDFALSNLVNAGVKNVGIFSNEENRGALIDHIGNGDFWDLNRKMDGVFYLTPSFIQGEKANIRLFEKNFEYFLKSRQENIIVMNSNIIYNIDLKEVIAQHERENNDITVVYKRIDTDEDTSFEKSNNLNIKNGFVIGSGTNLLNRENEDISLDLFIMSKSLFLELIFKRIQNGLYAGMKSLILENMKNYNVKGFEFKGYTKYINSVQAYFDFNMDLLNPEVKKEIFSKGRKIYTKVKDTSATKYDINSAVSNSLIANGCIISGEIKNSVLGRRVEIGKDSVVENCIILQECKIGEGVKLTNVIIDKGNLIEDNIELIGSKKYPLMIDKNIKGYNQHIKALLEGGRTN